MSPNLEIYIEGYKMDVDDKVGKVATTYQHFDFLNIGSVKANVTNRLSLPLTNNNKQRLEQIAPLSVITTKPYRNLSIMIIQDGQATIPSGVCQITGIQDRFNIDVQSGIKNFFDALDGKYLNDLDLSAYNGLWDNDRHDSLRNTTSGLCNPLIDYGHFVNNSTYVDAYTYGSAVIPVIAYSTLMDKLFLLAGYNKSGSIFSTSGAGYRYFQMGLMTRLVYNDVWMTKKKASATFMGTTVYQSLGLDTIFHYNKITDFNKVTDNIDTYYDLANAWYKITSGAAIPFFRATHTFTGYVDSIAGGAGFCTFHIYKNGVSVASVSGTAGNTFSVSYTDDCQLNDYFECYIGIRSNPAAVIDFTISSLRHDITPVNTTDTNRVQSTNWHWYFDQLLPRISLKDFFIDFMKMFCLAIRESNGTLEVKYIKDILGDTSPTTVEISRENKTKQPTISYDLQGFGKTYNNHWWVVQSDETLISTDFGKGSFSIDNTQLPVSVDRYTSLYTASPLSINTYGLPSMSSVKIYDQTVPGFKKAASYGSRLILMSYSSVSTRAVRHKAGTNRTDHRIGWFIDKQNQIINLDWQEFLNEFYSEYVDVLNRFVRVDQEYLVSLVEAKQMDLFKLKTKEGITYIIEKVENHVSGQFAKFKLIRR